MTLSITTICNAECRVSFIVLLSTIMLSVVMLSVVMLNVVMLSVVAPLNGRRRKWVFYHHLGTTLKSFYTRNLQVFEIS
jgi:hypothetical protein